MARVTLERKHKQRIGVGVAAAARLRKAGFGSGTLRALRSMRGWSQTDMALALGVPNRVVIMWENGARHISPSEEMEICQVFGVGPLDIAELSRIEAAVKRAR